MKLTFVVVLLACLQVSANSYAQEVSLNLHNTSIKKVFYELTKQTNYGFICDADLINTGNNISVHVSKMPLKQVLEECFAGIPVDIIINSDHTVAIKKMIIAPIVHLQKASIPITGKVVDEKNMPLPGVTVRVKGTQLAAVSNESGLYKIVAPNTGTILVFTSIGYITQEITVANKPIINVVLKEQNINLNETVVIGYATQSRRDLTGAVSSVNARQLRDVPGNSAIQALEGRLAGVNIVTTEGGPNAAVTINVRGGGSITQDNTPLYVVDGVQIENALNILSPQDIASVDVLKDAASTSIYGARGANGVVVITTKSGKAMKTVVGYNYYYGINKLANKFDVMNPTQFIEYNWERTRGTLTDSISFSSLYGTSWSGLDAIRNKPFVDWQQETFGQNAPTQTHNASITGGNKETTFNISYTNNNEQSIMVNSGYLRNLFSVRFDHNVNDKFKVGVNYAYNDNTIIGTGTSSSGQVSNNRLRNSVKYRPFLYTGTDPATAQDQAYFASTNATGYYLINPVLFANASYRHNRTYNTNISGYLNYNINSWLSTRATMGINKNRGEINVFDDAITYNAITNSAGQPIVSITNNNTTSINENVVLTFTNNKSKSVFSRNNKINVLVGQEIYQLSADNMVNQVRYFPNGITPEKALSQLSLGTSVPLYPSSGDSESRISSFFTRASYTYKDKYLANFTVRADGSSKFAPGRQWGYFPSGSFAWRISQEPFFSNIKAISDLKLRVSYGLSGNNRIGDYLYTSLYRSTSAPYTLNNTLIPGYSIASLANPNLKWESALSRNAGLDFGILNNKIQISLDGYINDTRDLLINVPIASNSGFTNQLQNVGSTRNRGLELQLSAAIFAKKDFRWNANFNISTNQNKVIKLSNVADHYFASSGWGAGNEYLVQVGQPIGTIYGYVADGMYTLDDFTYDATRRIYTLKPGVPNNSAAVGTPAPGTKKLKDLTGDGLVNVNDQTIIGNAQPKFTGGLNNQFSYKNFDVGIFINFVYGNKILNGDKVEFTNLSGTDANLLSVMNNRWKTINANGIQVQNQNTGAAPDVLAAINKDATIWQPIKGNNLELDSWAIEDGSFLRLNTVTLGYTLPDRWLNKVKIKGLRFYVTGSNLAVFTKYSGLDPEVSTKNYNYVTPGVDSSPYPRSRTYVAGVNVKF